MSTEIRERTAESAEPDAGRPAVMRSPLVDLHQKLGAELAIRDGWQVPLSYGSAERERQAIGAAIGIADVSARGKIDLRGAVDSSLAYLPQTHGATLARLSRNWALVLTPPKQLAASLPLLGAAANRETLVTDATSIYAGIALLGPRVPDLLLRLTSYDPSSLRPGDAVGVQLLRIPAILLHRELSLTAVEIYVPSEYARYAWEAVFASARPLAPAPVGLTALEGAGWH